MPYQVQDIKDELYDGTALTEDGYSAEIDFGVDGGCPACEIVLNCGDRETGEAVTFTLYDYVSGSYVATDYVINNVDADKMYVWPIDNRVITGKKFKIAHDVTLSTGTDGITVHGHVRPRSI